MPFNEPAAYMEKHSKHDSSVGSSILLKEMKSPACLPSTSSGLSSGGTATAISNTNRSNENPLLKFQGCKWEKVLDFDKMLKTIRNAERHYFHGSHDCHSRPVGSSNGKNSSGKYPPREQPQVQRLNAGDMHFYGMVPKKPFDVVVCDICLGIYTKMGFNNHMKIHHPQAWNLVSSKATIPKEAGHLNAGGQAGDNRSESVRTLNASGNPLADSTSHVAATTISTANNSRHKSSKSGGGSSGGSSRSRSKSKHHHHHQQQSQQQHASSASIISTHSSQASTANTDVSTHHTNTKGSKKSSSTLSSTEMKINAPLTVPKEIPHPEIQPITIFSSSSSNSSCSMPPTPKQASAEGSGSLQEASFPPITPVVVKEKSKASKRKSKSSAAAAAPVVPPVTFVAPENNESSNSSLEYTTIAANTSTGKSSKRSSKAKTGKDLKQLMEPQLSELDQAVSSITEGQVDVINEISNSNDMDGGNNISSTKVSNSGKSMGYKSEETALSRQVPNSTARQQQQQQQLQGQYNAMPMLPEGISNNTHQQPQLQQQNSNSEDNDNSMLTFDDMLDSKFINEILNTDESVIHFDESELDKAAQQQQQQQHQQQQQQHAFLQPTPSKRIRYDEQMGNGVNVEISGHQSVLPGKYASFQQQQQHQQQQQGQQAFQVTNLDEIKMYTTAIDPQQYLNQPQHQQQQHQHPQDQHQITTIDPMQLQQLLYQQQQQQQGINTYAVGGGLDEMAGTPMDQQQYTDSDVIMCSAEQLHKEGKINAADYATLAALSGNNNTYSNVDVNAMAAATQFQVYNIPSLTDDDMGEANTAAIDSKMCTLPPNDVIVPQNHYVLPAEGNDDEQLIYEITANNQVAVISQQRQQQMIAEFLTQAGYDSVDNVNMNINNGGVAGAPNATETVDTKNSVFDSELHNELLDFDFSRIETVTSCGSSSGSSSSSSSTEIKSNIKSEPNGNGKYIQSSAIPDDLFVNLFLYAGLPRPLAVNCFGLIKLPQAAATTFRKNLHTTRKANNSPVSLNSGATRFSTGAANTKSASAQNYFTAVGSGAANTAQMNEFSIGGINNQTSGNSNLTLQQQQQQLASQKHGLMPGEVGFNATSANGLITANMSSPSPPTSSLHNTSNSRSSRPKSAGSANANTQLKQRTSSNSQSCAATSPLPQAPTKTIFVNNNSSQADQSKFVKRSLVGRMNPPAGNFPNFTAKQLSDIFLHPTKDSKEKYLQLLAARDQDKDSSTGSLLEQQRMNKVKSFYERRKRLLNTATNGVSSGYNHVRPRNSQQVPTASATALLRQRLMRTLSDCSINMKSNNNSANTNSNNDILRVFA